MGWTPATRAQDSPQRAVRRNVLMNAKNFVVTLNSGTTYYYLVSSEQNVMMVPAGDRVTIQGTEFAKKDIKSMRFYELEQFLLDEDSLTYDRKRAYDHGLVGVRRSLQPGKWNTLVLPMSLTGRQIVDAFGEGTVLATLTGVREGDLTTIEFDAVDLDTDEVVYEANYCCLIRPTREPDLTASQRLNFAGERVYGPLWLIPNASMKAGQTPRLKSVYSEDRETSIRMRGTYTILDGSDKVGNAVRNPQIAAGTYSINADGILVENTEPATIHAFECWIENMGTTTALKFYVNGPEEYVSDMADFIRVPQSQLGNEAANVYDLQGRCVGVLPAESTLGSLSLPRGIYIVRGQKYVVN